MGVEDIAHELFLDNDTHTSENELLLYESDSNSDQAETQATHSGLTLHGLDMVYL